MLIDTHAHLSFPHFGDDLQEAISRAAQAGVTRIVNVGTNLETSRAAVQLASESAAVYATAGFHPHDVAEVDERALIELGELIRGEPVVAVGETGLDFFRDYAPRETQEIAFRAQIDLAVKHDLPLVVHSRGAEDLVLDILDEQAGGRARGVLHCFGGNRVQAARAVSMGFLLGFGGTLTFKNSDALSVALSVDDTSRVLETDCPYLAPVPHRGKRNEPAFVSEVARFLASHLGISTESVADRTTRNAERLFGIEEAS